ncbi:MAG TPA: sigma-70 family RNA polymerase sigma factor [Acidimicrobiales bacterium]
MQETDPGLIRRAAAGDIEAFSALVEQHQLQVWRFLRRLLGDEALAEDVTQETFVRVYTRLSSFTFEAKFSTWVFQIARNAGIDELRKRQRQARLAETLGRRDLTALPSPEVGVELQMLLDQLPDDLRAALLLVEILGLRYREAGDVLGIPTGTVKSRVHNARVKLHEWAQAGERRRHRRGARRATGGPAAETGA